MRLAQKSWRTSAVGPVVNTVVPYYYRINQEKQHMLGKNKLARPNCKLWDTTQTTINARSVTVAHERVVRDGLPVAVMAQLVELHSEMVDVAMTEVGLPQSPCDNCFDKVPVDCPNQQTVAPEALDYEHIADIALGFLRQRVETQRDTLQQLGIQSNKTT